ncbi:MarR family transcriptional regulator [Tamlana sedimentorum]|uniref:HTH-type transcriptional regulator SarZ n=1 Tax=Neotamlana sedimentorum TaxID=1435349 RepID=A0A0D7W6X6_9FLAO|nr:MarR family transcriptional regulator [Tamlana sedimentorum]KJD34871.1 MarR family transcriptional regulator [Tamlana sedimentorum]
MNDKLNINEQICFPIYLLAKDIIALYKPLLNALNLTYPQYLVMLVLWENETRTVNTIGKTLNLDSGTLTPLLKRLQQKELVTRTRSVTDERVVNISLTTKGAQLKNEAQCIPEQMMEAMNVSVEDLTTLKELVIKILNSKK